MTKSSHAAPTTLRSRLRHCVPCAVDRGPRPGQSNGPGLPVLPSSRFWATIAPFTPDDDLFSGVWPLRGRWSVTELNFRLAGFPDRSYRRTWDDWDDLCASLNCHDAPEPWWEPVPRRLGTWRVLDLGEPGTT